MASFLTLPAELRNAVYDYYISGISAVHLDSSDLSIREFIKDAQPASKDIANLMQSNPQVCDELGPALHGPLLRPDVLSIDVIDLNFLPLFHLLQKTAFCRNHVKVLWIKLRSSAHPHDVVARASEADVQDVFTPHYEAWTSTDKTIGGISDGTRVVFSSACGELFTGFLLQGIGTRFSQTPDDSKMLWESFYRVVQKHYAWVPLRHERTPPLVTGNAEIDTQEMAFNQARMGLSKCDDSIKGGISPGVCDESVVRSHPRE